MSTTTVIDDDDSIVRLEKLYAFWLTGIRELGRAAEDAGRAGDERRLLLTVERCTIAQGAASMVRARIDALRMRRGELVEIAPAPPLVPLVPPTERVSRRELVRRLARRLWGRS